MHEVPITSITNGVHTKTWMAPEFAAPLSASISAIREEHSLNLIFGAASSTFLTRTVGDPQQLKRRLIDFVRDRNDNVANAWANRQSRFAESIRIP